MAELEPMPTPYMLFGPASPFAALAGRGSCCGPVSVEKRIETESFT